MEYVLAALGLVLIVEGLAWALAPSAIEAMLAALRELPIETRRLVGLAALAMGALLLWGAIVLGA